MFRFAERRAAAAANTLKHVTHQRTQHKINTELHVLFFFLFVRFTNIPCYRNSTAVDILLGTSHSGVQGKDKQTKNNNVWSEWVEVVSLCSRRGGTPVWIDTTAGSEANTPCSESQLLFFSFSTSVLFNWTVKHREEGMFWKFHLTNKREEIDAMWMI